MSDRRWPSFAEIETMDSTEAYDLYWNLPAPANADQLAIIRTLGDHAWSMRQQEEVGKPQRQVLPMPEPAAEAAAPPPPKPKIKKRPQLAREEPMGGAQFFLAGLRS